ncbi:unnamed protein product, partial [Nesidiocoris tenuis]
RSQPFCTTEGQPPATQHRTILMETGRSKNSTALSGELSASISKLKASAHLSGRQFLGIRCTLSALYCVRRRMLPRMNGCSSINGDRRVDALCQRGWRLLELSCCASMSGPASMIQQWNKLNS